MFLGITVSHDLHIFLRNALMIDLPVNIAIPVYSGLQIAGKCIYAGNTDTVKSSGNLIRTLSELTAGIQPGKTDLQGTLSDLRMETSPYSL